MNTRTSPIEPAPRAAWTLGRHRRAILGIALAALLLRGAVFAAISHRHHYTLAQYARQYDGASYLITAQAMLGDRSRFNAFHGRVFPAYPALIALLGRAGVRLDVGALAIDWLSAAAAAAMAALLFEDLRVGWAMAMLIPHYLMNSTMAMSEAPLLALTLAGLLAARGGSTGSTDEAGIVDRSCAASAPASRHSAPSRAGRSVIPSLAGGALLGAAALVRPMACFAFAGRCLVDLLHRHWWRALLLSAAAAIVVTAGVAALAAWRGSALAGLRAQETYAYGGHPFAWPFWSLLTTPARRAESIGRIAYIWAHVLLALAGCVAITLAMIRPRLPIQPCACRESTAAQGSTPDRPSRPVRRDARDVLSFPWLVGNTAFVLCVGNIWGFECFHRFLIPALPPLFWALRRFLPRRTLAWCALAVISAAIAMLSA